MVWEKKAPPAAGSSANSDSSSSDDASSDTSSIRELNPQRKPLLGIGKDNPSLNKEGKCFGTPFGEDLPFDIAEENVSLKWLDPVQKFLMRLECNH